MRTITSLTEFLHASSDQLAGTAFPCPYCGRTHPVPIGKIVAGYGVVAETPVIAARILGHPPRRAGVIYDKAIEPIIEGAVLGPLAAQWLEFERLPLGEPGLLLESSAAVGLAGVAAVPPETDILIGAGSGVIADLTKWIATRTARPFILVGTAASMNAHTSITATITENDIKGTVYLNPADAVIFDINILAGAPQAMTQAGMGDLAARAICNADWRLANVLKGAYFCPLPYQMTAENERLYLQAAKGIGRSDPDAIALLAEATLKSGLSMTVLEGETSPSSGSEHILSHYWDYLVHLRGLPRNFHGAQVGVGTVISLALFDIVRRMDPGKIDPQALLRRRTPFEEIERSNNELYGAQAASFNAVVRRKWLPDAEYQTFVRHVRDTWETLWEAVGPYIPPIDAIRQPLRQAGASLTLAAIQRTHQEGLEALLQGARYRTRYTLLDLAWELGLFPTAAEEALTLAEVI